MTQPALKQAPRPWRATLSFLLPLLLMAQGCTLVKLSYNQADTLLYWRLDSYADFSSEQAPRVKTSLAQFHQWHRRTQLPVYANLLQGIRPKLAESMSGGEACAVVDQLRSALDATLDPAHWTLLWLAGELSEEQLRHIERKQAVGDAEWKKEWVSATPEKVQEARFEQALSRSEMLFGSLDEPQKAALRAATQATSFDPQRHYAERLRRGQDLRQVLRKIREEKPGNDAARALLKGYADRVLVSPDPAYRRYAQTLLREGCASFARLHEATTPAQRDKANQTLAGYERDFRQLAQQP